MQVAVKDINGKELKQIELPEAVYGLEMKEHLLHQVIKAYLANRRQGTHATKTRSMVRGGVRSHLDKKVPVVLVRDRRGLQLIRVVLLLTGRSQEITHRKSTNKLVSSL